MLFEFIVSVKKQISIGLSIAQSLALIFDVYII